MKPTVTSKLGNICNTVNADTLSRTYENITKDPHNHGSISLCLMDFNWRSFWISVTKQPLKCFNVATVSGKQENLKIPP